MVKGSTRSEYSVEYGRQNVRNAPLFGDKGRWNRAFIDNVRTRTLKHQGTGLKYGMGSVTQTLGTRKEYQKQLRTETRYGEEEKDNARYKNPSSIYAPSRQTKAQVISLKTSVSRRPQ